MFGLEAGRTTRLELSNANALVDSSVTAVGASARQIAPEIALYERVKRAACASVPLSQTSTSILATPAGRS